MRAKQNRKKGSVKKRYTTRKDVDYFKWLDVELLKAKRRPSAEHIKRLRYLEFSEYEIDRIIGKNLPLFTNCNILPDIKINKDEKH